MAGVPTSTSRNSATLPWHQLEAILSASAVRPGTSSDAIDGIIPARVATPSTEDQVSATLRWANDNGVRVTVSGGGTKQAWSNPPENLDLLLSTSRLARVIEHAHHDMTATVQAGLTVAQLQSELARHNQRLALDSLWPERATIGGIVACNDSGPLRLRFGSIRDLLIGATIILADGTIARSGGKVVKNVAGYDLPKLFTGSQGTLGVLTEVTFRVHPLPLGTETLTFDFPDCATANNFILAINDSTLVPASVQLRHGSDQPTQVDIQFECHPEGMSAQLTAAKDLCPTSSCPTFRGEAPNVGVSPTNSTDLQPNAVWLSRQSLFDQSPSNFVCKFSVLPSDISGLAGELASACPADFHLVAQATGLGFFSARCTPENIASLRATLANNSGSLVVLYCPPELRSRVDVFGPLPDTYPLMVRIKQRFDPNGILNRGRFIGGI